MVMVVPLMLTVATPVALEETLSVPPWLVATVFVIELLYVVVLLELDTVTYPLALETVTLNDVLAAL